MPRRKILVPVDGSSAALRALDVAARRSRESRDDVAVVVLNVQTRLPPSRYVTRSMIRDHHERISAQALRGARALARRAQLDAAFHARLGDPGPSIARFARATKCTEIIMGTRGRSRMASFVLGSVAMRVVQLTELPVTLIK